MKTVAINKSGRKPKAGVDRYPGGQIVHAQREPEESEEDIKATALEARMRHEWGVDTWLATRGSPKNMSRARRRLDEPLLSDKNPLGRLLLIGRKNPAKGINQAQYNAGQDFIRVYAARAKIGNWPKPTAPAIDYGAARGLSTHPENSPEWEADIKRQFEDMCRRIYDLNVGKVYEVMKRALIEGNPPSDMDEVGLLRMGLNAINRARGA